MTSSQTLQRTGIVKDIIVLKSDVEGTEGLKSEIQQMVRQRLSTQPIRARSNSSPHGRRRRIGKIQRFILRGGA